MIVKAPGNCLTLMHGITACVYGRAGKVPPLFKSQAESARAASCCKAFSLNDSCDILEL